MKKVLLVLALLAGSFLSAVEVKEETVATWPKLHQAIWNGDTNKALKLCNKHPEQMTELAAFEFAYPGLFSYYNDSFKPDDFKYSALELAILQGNTEVAKKLIESGEQVERKREKITKMVKLISNNTVKMHHTEITPLRLAIETKQYDIVKELIKVVKSINEIQVDYYYDGHIVFNELVDDGWHSSNKTSKVWHLFTEPDEDIVAVSLSVLSDLEGDLAHEIAALIVQYEGKNVHAIENAISENDFAAFELLIAYYPKALYKEAKNKTSLLKLITSSSPEYFEAFLSSPFFSLYAPAKVLEVASGTGHLEAMQWALDQGGTYFGPAYAAAIEGNQLEALELLMVLSEPSYQEVKVAIDKNKIDCFRLLIPFVDLTTQNIEKLLFDMCYRPDILDYFLREYEITDVYRYVVWTPKWWPFSIDNKVYDIPINCLQLACRTNSFNVVKVYVEYQKPTEEELKGAIKFAKKYSSMQIQDYLYSVLYS